MDSFYGGKQGTSVVIKARFKYTTSESQTPEDSSVIYKDKWYGYEKDSVLSADIMEDQLSDPNYKQVWYGEYCIIDHPNKRNPNNGKVYRRTLKGKANKTFESEDVGGVAEYIGQIVGPPGMPTVLDTLTNVKQNESNFNQLQLDDYDYLYFKDANGQTQYVKIVNNTSASLQLKLFNVGVNNGGIQLIPGNTTNTNTNIKSQYFNQQEYIQTGGYNWYNYQDNNVDGDGDSKLNIGLDIPYYVVDFQPDVTIQSEISNATITNTVTNAPFYSKYQLSIPRGYRGAWLEISREKIDITKTYYQLTNIQLNSSTNPSKYEIPNNTQPYQIDASRNKGTAWIGTFKWFAGRVNNEDNIQSIENIFIGWDREIENITLDSSTTGKFLITFTDKSAEKSWYLQLPIGMQLQANGQLQYTHTSATASVTHAVTDTIGTLTWITNIQRDTTPTSSTFNHLLVTLNNTPTGVSTNNNVVDLGNVVTTREGLYVTSNTDTFEYQRNNSTLTYTYNNGTSQTTTDYNSISAALKGVYGADNRVRIIQYIEKDGNQIIKAESQVYYYDSGDATWKLLGTLSSMLAGAKIQESAIPLNEGGLLLNQQAAPATTTSMTTPWR